MQKRSVYIETSVVSYLVARPSRDLLIAACQQAFIDERGLPSKAQADALHIALAAVHRIDLLLTWNCRHIDNPTTKPIVRSICASAGHDCPEICTPIEILEAADEK